MQHAGLASVRQSDDVSQMQYGTDVSEIQKLLFSHPTPMLGEPKSCSANLQTRRAAAAATQRGEYSKDFLTRL